MLRTLSSCAALCALVLALASSHASAQAAPELPAPSPKARVEQRVGLTDFSVDYSSPGVKARPIWGALVPYDRPWRTGANAATKLTASRDFSFGGKPVPAGSYGLYTIPGKATWTVVLNTNTDTSGPDGFDAAKDVARVVVKPTLIRGRERLTFFFNDTTDDGTKLELQWEKLSVAVPIAVNTKAQAQAGIDKAIEDAWRPHFSAARYLLDNGGDMDKALALSDQSIAIKSTWWNNWVRAQVLAKKNRTPEAVAAAQNAVQLGTGDRVFESFFKADVQKAIATWQKKS